MSRVPTRSYRRNIEPGSFVKDRSFTGSPAARAVGAPAPNLSPGINCGWVMSSVVHDLLRFLEGGSMRSGGRSRRIVADDRIAGRRDPATSGRCPRRFVGWVEASPSFLVSNSEGLQSLWLGRTYATGSLSPNFFLAFSLNFPLEIALPIPYHRRTVDQGGSDGTAGNQTG